MQKIRLKAARVNAGLSQCKVAEAMEVSKSSISRWELGESRIPEDAFQKMCILYRIDPKYVEKENVR